MTLSVSAHPDPRDVRFLDERINAFNVESTHVDDGKEVAIFIRDPGGKILAGLYGWTWAKCLQVEYLWVDESERGKGHGSEMLRTAEQSAIERGCRQALLDTHSFQAPDFYEKRGYVVFGVVDDYPPGHKKFYLRKQLQPPDA